MLNDTDTYYPDLQTLLDMRGLSAENLPDPQDWQVILGFMKQRETLIDVLRQSAIDIPGSLVFVFDDEMIIVAANAKAAEALGFQHEYELIGRHARDFIAPDTFEASHKRFEVIMQGEELPEYERTLCSPDGTLIHTLLKLSLIGHPDSETKFVKSVMRDVTELRNAEAEAKRHQDYLMKVLENAPVVLWACDANGVMTLSHGMGLESIGRESGETVGTNLFETYSYDPHIIEHIEKALWGEKQHTRIEINGSVFDARFHPMIEDDRVVGIVGVSTDITSLVQAERQVQAIQKSTERTRDYLQAILNNTSDGIAVATLDGKIQHTNPAFNQLLGLNRDEAYGKPLAFYADKSEKSMITSMIEYVKSSGQSVRFEATTISESPDTELSTDILCSPIVTDTGDLYGIVFSIRDITAYRELLGSLAESRDQALQTSRLKSEFLAVMSHEVRTPLHAIMGVTEMVQDTDLKDDQRELVTLIQSQSNQLLEMLNSILDYSKLEAEKMILERRVFQLKDFIEAIGKPFIGQAWHKNLEIQVSTDIPDKLPVYGDVHRLRQVLHIFISNALKFTEKGRIDISCILLSKTDDSATVRFAIADRGIGIPPEKIDTLFSPFVQADSSHTRRYGGTGLGLAIASRILTLMNSEIRVKSVVNAGTTFEFDLSFNLATA